MPRRPSNSVSSWTTRELTKLRTLAKTTTATQAARALGRTPAATQQRAMRSGISFRRRSSAQKK
jgi:hypothetical protein